MKKKKKRSAHRGFWATRKPRQLRARECKHCRANLGRQSSVFVDGNEVVPFEFRGDVTDLYKKKSLATYAMLGYRRINLTVGHQSRKAHARASPPMLEAPTVDCWPWMAIFSPPPPPMFRKVKAKRRDQSTEKLKKKKVGRIAEWRRI